MNEAGEGVLVNVKVNAEFVALLESFKLDELLKLPNKQKISLFDELMQFGNAKIEKTTLTNIPKEYNKGSAYWGKNPIGDSPKEFLKK